MLVKRFIFLFLMSLIIGIATVSAWSTNNFNNSLTSENLSINQTAHLPYGFVGGSGATYNFTSNTTSSCGSNPLADIRFNTVFSGERFLTSTCGTFGAQGIWSSAYDYIPNCNTISYSKDDTYFTANQYICVKTNSSKIALMQMESQTGNHFTWNWVDNTYSNSTRFLSVPSTITDILRGYINLSSTNILGYYYPFLNWQNENSSVNNCMTTDGLTISRISSCSSKNSDFGSAYQLVNFTKINNVSFTYSNNGNWVGGGTCSGVPKNTSMNVYIGSNKIYSQIIGTGSSTSNTSEISTLGYSGMNNLTFKILIEMDPGCSSSGGSATTTISNIQTRSIALNPSITIGSNTIWNYLGVFNQTNNKTDNLRSIINSYLSTCTITNGYCNVPFVFSSNLFDIIKYSDLQFGALGFIENSQTYSATSLETYPQNLSINISYDSSAWSTILSYLYYNGNSYSGTQIGIGNDLIFNREISSPSNSGNYQFYWYFILTNSSGNFYYNSSTNSQTITPTTSISVNSTCSAGLVPAFYFDIKKEANLSSINGSINYNVLYGVSNTSAKSSSGSLSNINSFNICINNSQSYYSVGYGEIQYQVTGDSARRYYIFSNTRLTNETVNNTLYSLESASSTSFQFTIQDTSLNPYSGYYLGLLRWYPDLNTYKVVEMAKTDDKGQTVMKVKTEDVDYRIAIYSTDGTLIKLANPIRMICQTNPCTYTLIVSTENTDYTSFLNIQSNLSFDYNTSKFTYIWNDPTQIQQTMNLTVYRDSGTSSNSICSTKAQAYTGVLTCDVSAYTGNFRAVVIRTASPGVIIAQYLAEVKSRIIDTANGKGISTFIVVILSIFIGLIGIANPIIAIIFGIVGLVVAYALGSITKIILIGIAVIGGIVIHFMKRTG